MFRRTSCCWRCTRSVDNSVDKTCPACGWIICSSCGACAPTCFITIDVKQSAAINAVRDYWAAIPENIRPEAPVFINSLTRSTLISIVSKQLEITTKKQVFPQPSIAKESLLGRNVSSQSFGEGTVVRFDTAQSGNEYVTIEFNNGRQCRFAFPDAFTSALFHLQ